jgi:two-component system, cell cycle response regulator
VRILLAEDSEFYRRMIATYLTEWGFDLVTARDGKEAWKLLVEPAAPRMALLDWVMPNIEGVELCRRLRRRAESEAYVYTLLLTAKRQRQQMLEAMDAGADDFLAKPFDPPELKARLLVGKRIVELQQKLASTNDALRLAASHDSLTQIWNRGEILRFLGRELARSRRTLTPLGVVLVDVDHFKKINDELGHQTGDLVLQELAERFSSNLREYDGVGRYGGEEFLLVIPGCDLARLVQRANEIRTLVSREPFLSAPGAPVVTVSMGVAESEASEKAEALLRRTDEALYRAKRSGRNRVESAKQASTVAEF